MIFKPALACVLTIVLSTIQGSTQQLQENQSSNSTTCLHKCGEISIPYPFGIGTGSNCSLNNRYTIVCKASSDHPPKPFLHTPNLEVLDISLDNHTITVKSPVLSNCLDETAPLLLTRSPFSFSSSVNRFVSLGCDNTAEFRDENQKKIGGCMSYCHVNYDHDNRETSTTTTTNTSGSCLGRGCCQTRIPSWLKVLDVSFKKTSSGKRKKPDDKCSYAFIVEKTYPFNSSLEFLPNDILLQIEEPKFVHAALDWSLSNNGTCVKASVCGPNAHCTMNSNESYICLCDNGYGGNPYDECTDINECASANGNPCGRHSICKNTEGGYNCSCSSGHSYRGNSCKLKIKYIGILALVITAGSGLILLIGCSWCLRRQCKTRKEQKLKKKYFKHNGGLLLQEQLSSSKDTIENTTLFTSKELEKATDNYNNSRILGRGGQGIVYKGILTDGRIVAVKKSRVLDASKVKQFVNEVVILSKINHRNVVKILGCCLETEHPQLVYEFIPNGTLFQYIHNENEEFPFSWDMRLQIATEVAEALYYLHSAASLPIYHRDIKSTNILLDDRFRAKVADFGVSKSILIDHSHITTRVQGTFGYLDPEYFHTNQFTEKSDVYSFGVVLAELLTSLEPILSTSQEEIGLAAHFVMSVEQHRLINIVDARIIGVASKGELMAVANLARRCLNLNGKKRPTMKAVAVELEGIRMSREASRSNKVARMRNAVRTDFCNPYLMLQLH
ncbi:hypothetical protein TIFTF001_001632 [Ficus carica]|uniref:Uncharacterized protein n=1 Tax=Ficus carica TaxID=3494 RepID=A0AA87Z0Y8_FICCA|nr:hypothetical protein TIFTF001_001632 [Ficus carica]